MNLFNQMVIQMPNRLIRDEMLESESILSLPVEARWFYVTILLSADDIGLFEATSFKLARRADIRRESGESMLQMLADVGLVRLYEVNNKRYGFIPRFRQRLQIKRSKYPAPPKSLILDDVDATNKINDLANKTTDVQPLSTDVQQYISVIQPSEPEPEPEQELENKKKNTTRGTRLPANATLSPEYRDFCEKTRPDLIPDQLFEGFRDYWIAQPGQKGVKLDWFATWRTWVRNQKTTQATTDRKKPNFAVGI